MADPLLRVTAAKTLTANGTGHIYVETEHGKKVAAVWGNAADKLRYAHLFAAAPELFDIAVMYCSLVQSDYEGRNGTMGSMQAAYDRATAAIKKARGVE